MKNSSYSTYLDKWDNSAEWFYNKIRKTPILSIDEQRALVFDAQKGDMEARNLVVTHNLRLVVRMAGKMSNRHPRILTADLVQEGAIGLLSAIRNFDPARGTAFTTLAVFWVHQKIERYIHAFSSMVPMPEYVACFRKQYDQLTDEFEQELGRSPTKQELAKALETTPQIVDALRHRLEVVSLDRPVGPDEDTPLKDLIGVTEPTVSDERLDMVVGLLTGRDRKVLLARIRGETLKQIGIQLDLSRERVRQLEKRAIREVKRKLAQIRKGAIQIQTTTGPFNPVL